MIRFVSNYGIFFGRMRSSLGKNSFVGCRQFGCSTGDLHFISRSMLVQVSYMHNSDEDVQTAKMLLELIACKHAVFGFGCFDSGGFTGCQIDDMIADLCTT